VDSSSGSIDRAGEGVLGEMTTTRAVR
jgi:hypothetical protein